MPMVIRLFCNPVVAVMLYIVGLKLMVGS